MDVDIENDADAEEDVKNDPFAEDVSLCMYVSFSTSTHASHQIMEIAVEVKKPKSKSKGSKSSKAVTAPVPPHSCYVIQVTGDKNPFINAAHTLSRSAWNRLRVYIQIVDGFPRGDERRAVIVDLIRDLVLMVPVHRRVWKRLSEDHRYLMINFVSVPFDHHT